ncbi:glycosyltransferase family 4 protein [Thomasclavelia saccharogumia]|uniref:glycosyltransferase family 4 protein n=1 Tax=Thomasclavelia saccharogumia TaxID=341225 RepID=UPI00055080E8|nr:glycosyltransferase family 4 protein [Thomasclavelia saccharogumia]
MIKKVLFVATVVKTHINVFHIPYLKMLKEMGYETHVAARNDFEDSDDCIIPYCDYYHDMPFERSPIKFNNVKTYKQLKELIFKENFDIIHCHTPMGGVLSRLAYKSLKNKVKTKIIYTAHGFHFYKGAPLINWVLYYPVEKYLSKYTDILITINKEDYNRAKNKFKMKRLEYVPGVGVDNSKFKLHNFDKEIYRKELGLHDRDIMLLSVGELISRKNHKVVIEALAKLNNPNIHYYIAGRGKLKNKLEQCIKELNLVNQVHLLGFRKDIIELNKAADIFVFPSKQEGLPVALMEAMVLGKPIICSKIRGNIDLISDNENGYLFEFQNIDEVKNLILDLSNDNSKKLYMGKLSKEKIKPYLLDNILIKMKEIYRL